MLQHAVPTIEEVAALLKTAERTACTMIQRGDQPAFKVWGKRRFNWKDIDAWIEAPKPGKVPPGDTGGGG